MRSKGWILLMLLAGSMCGAYGMAAAHASADHASGPMGEWVMRIGKRTMFVLTVRPADKAEQACAGSFSRPQHLQTADGVSFNHVKGPVETGPIVSCEGKEGGLSITVENPRDASDRDTYRLTVHDAGHADLQIEGVAVPPIKLERAAGAVAVSTDWDAEKSYSAEDDAPSNAEMKRIFDEDQRVRQSGLNADFAAAARTDAERREATRRLLSNSSLHTGQDFWEAAFVFQHGSTPEDYLLAHTLAIVALKKGNQDGAWIAAATLDRYLQSIKQPQIYGTQFLWPKGEPTTQDPYNRTLISDSLRQQLGVPSVEQQRDQLKEWNKERGIQRTGGGR